MKSSNLKYILYARKSSENEDLQTLSIESQLHELEAFARMHNLSVIETITEAQSAKNPGRLGYEQMRTHLREGGANAILTWKLDRLARHPLEGGELILLLEEGKLLQITTPQRTFINNGSDKFLMQMEFGMAKKFLDDLSDNVKRGNRTKLERGWLPGMPPVGYMNDSLSRTIIPDPDRFHLVRQMWDMALAGKRVSEIVSIANETWGFRSRKHARVGGRPLAVSTLYMVLRNPFYYGLLVRNDESFPGSHKPMITKAQFDQMQTVLSHRVHAHRSHHFAYTGLLRCGQCGCAITAERQVNGQGHRYIYYHCTHRSKTHDCTQGSVRQEQLEQQLVGYLRSFSLPGPLEQWALLHLEELADRNPEFQAITERSVHQAYEDTVRHEKRLLDLHLRQLVSEEEYLEKRGELEEQLAHYRGLLDRGQTEEQPVVKLDDLTRLREGHLKLAKPFAIRQMFEIVAARATLLNRNVSVVPFCPLPAPDLELAASTAQEAAESKSSNLR